ncbi:MAG: flagellar FliJ family protein [Alphaproteobacteria bacterium]|nr:flagellar FliJ family protein [Alphaproteobacteria bacterium]
MSKALKTLERVKKFELDEQRRRLALKLDNLAKLQTALHHLNSDYEKEKEFVSRQPALYDFGAFTAQYLKKRRALEESIEKAEADISQLRDIMADVFKEQKTFEIIDNIQQKAKQKMLDDAEQKMLDEIGTNAYIKHHSSSN